MEMSQTLQEESTLSPEQKADLLFEIFASATAINKLLYHAHADAAPLNDVNLTSTLDFLRRHTGGILHHLGKQIFQPNNLTNE